MRDVPTPEPRKGELRVRVRVATVNRTDCGGLRGQPFIYRFFVGFPRPRFVATGTDFAGDVEAVGEEVSRFAVGDRIFGFDDKSLGTHAEIACLSEKKSLTRIPDDVSYENAVASAEGAHYARNFLNKIPLAPDQHVLVIGGTGAIGSAAIQLLRHQGVRTTAICLGPHVAEVLALGAERVIDQGSDDFVQVLFSEGATFDHVLDAVGKSRFTVCRPLMKTRGRYLSSELGPRAENVYLALAGPFYSPFLSGRRVIFPFPLDCQGSLDAMAGLLAEGAFRPLIDRSYAIEEIQDAFRHVESGAKLGNVILRLS